MPVPKDPVGALHREFGEVHVLHGPVRVAAGRWRDGRAVAYLIGNERGYRLSYFPISGPAMVVRRGSIDDPLDYAIRAIFACTTRDGGKGLVVLYRVGRALPGLSDDGSYAGDVYRWGGKRGWYRDTGMSKRLDGAMDARTARRRLAG